MRLLKNSCVALPSAALLFGQFGCPSTSDLLTTIQFTQRALNPIISTAVKAIAPKAES